MKEVEGHDVDHDHAEPNTLAQKEHNHELEFKLLLSKTFRDGTWLKTPSLLRTLPSAIRGSSAMPWAPVVP